MPADKNNPWHTWSDGLDGFRGVVVADDLHSNPDAVIASDGMVFRKATTEPTPHFWSHDNNKTNHVNVDHPDLSTDQFAVEAFDGGNVLHNDGSVTFKHAGEVRMNALTNNGNHGFFW